MSDLILIVDDEAALTHLVAAHLKRMGFRTVSAADGIAALQAFYQHHPDLVLLDVMLPEMDGWTVCARLREFSDVPIIMLTARSEQANRLKGFQTGVDDYVVKPPNLAELTARIRAVLARSHHRPPGDAAGPLPVVVGDLLIDLAARRILRGGRPVRLTPTEWRLLAALAEQPGQVRTPKELIASVWSDEHADEADNVKRYIHHLRQNLETDPDHPRLILTERGQGYLLNLSPTA